MTAMTSFDPLTGARITPTATSEPTSAAPVPVNEGYWIKRAESARTTAMILGTIGIFINPFLILGVLGILFGIVALNRQAMAFGTGEQVVKPITSGAIWLGVGATLVGIFSIAVLLNS